MRAFEERFIQLRHPLPGDRRPALLRAGRDPRRHRLSALVCQPDDDLAFERIVNVPQARHRRHHASRSCAQRPALAERQPARRRRARWSQTDELPARARNALGQLLARLRPLARRCRERSAHASWPRRCWRRAATPTMWQAERSPDAAGPAGEPEGAGQGDGRVRDAAGLPRACQPGDGRTRPTADADMVSIMTLHGAKGLEFTACSCPAGRRALFPSQRAMDEGGRRRSRRSAGWPTSASPAPGGGCTISFAANRRVYNQWQSQLPSRFVDELPARPHRAPAPQPGHAPDLGSFLDDEPSWPARPSRLPLAPGRARQADRGPGRDPVGTRPVGKSGASRSATGSSTTSSATGRSRRSRATSSTSRSRSGPEEGDRQLRRSRPERAGWPRTGTAAAQVLWRARFTVDGPSMPDVLERFEDDGAQRLGVRDRGRGRRPSRSGWRLDLLFAEAPDTQRCARPRLARDAGAARSRTSRSTPVPAQDWVPRPRLHLAPVPAGRFVVHGSHAREALPAGAGPDRDRCRPRVRLGRARHHPGLPAGDRRAGAAGAASGAVLDVGCGSGVLAIAAAQVLAGEGDRRRQRPDRGPGRRARMPRSTASRRACTVGRVRRLPARLHPPRGTLRPDPRQHPGRPADRAGARAGAAPSGAGRPRGAVGAARPAGRGGGRAHTRPGAAAGRGGSSKGRWVALVLRRPRWCAGYAELDAQARALAPSNCGAHRPRAVDGPHPAVPQWSEGYAELDAQARTLAPSRSLQRCCAVRRPWL